MIIRRCLPLKQYRLPTTPLMVASGASSVGRFNIILSTSHFDLTLPLTVLMFLQKPFVGLDCEVAHIWPAMRSEASLLLLEVGALQTRLIRSADYNVAGHAIPWVMYEANRPLFFSITTASILSYSVNDVSGTFRS